MYKTKKEVDAHVRTALSKMRTEADRNLRGFTIAKLYYKVNDFVSAEQFLLSYLKVREDNDQAYKLLGQCYQRLKKPDKALQAYQRSLQLNGKQPEILIEVCQLLLEDNDFNTQKARYWCELAESEKVQHDAVFSLRLKMMNKGDMQSNQLEELIYKEIAARPKDVNLRVRLLRTYIEQNRLLDAFAYVRKLQFGEEQEFFNHNGEWQNIVWLVLNKYEQTSNMKRDWDFWVLIVSCLERQLVISFSLSTSSGCTETANLLFQLDQYLFKFSHLTDKFSGVQKEMVQVCLNHFRGQLLLHAASLMYKRELLQNKNMWKETVKNTLPLLFLAYQVEPPENKEPWMKHCDEQSKKLLQLWYREGAFRCAQASRIIFSCITEEEAIANKDNATQIVNNLLIGGTPNSHLWSSSDDLLAQLRQTCSDKQWRHHIFVLLYCNSDQRMKEKFSLLVKSQNLAEPKYELPSYEDVERHEEVAQLLQPQSLAHMVYLSLGTNNLADVRAHYFSGLNFSTQHLAFCGAESLNRLDIETFLYAAVLQAKRLLEVERDMLESYQSGNRNAVGRPQLLPFVNLQAQLCNEEQAYWWQAAYQVYKNLCNENLSEMRAKLQHGIEAVRGINGTKIDMLIVFKLGKIFVQRAQDVVKPVEKAFLEARAESLYKHGLNMLKLYQKGVLEPFHKYFKYARSNTSAVEAEIIKAAEDAVSYLAAQYFKKGDYENFIEEFNGLQLPFATYMQAEAYRRLEEADNTPKKGRRMYLDRAFECLNQTLTLLKNTQIDPDHPLNSVVQSEMRNLHQSFGKYMFNNSATTFSPANGNNSSNYEDAEDSFAGELPIAHTSARRLSHSRRESAGLSKSTVGNLEIEQLIKQMMGTLSFVKEELVETIKPELLTMRKEITSLKDKIANMEQSMKNAQENVNMNMQNANTADDAVQVLDDLYIIEDALHNQLYAPNTPVSANQPNLPSQNSYLNQNQQLQHQQQSRIQTPNALQMQQNAAVVAAYASNPMFNPNYAAMAYYSQSPYMMATQGAAATSALLGRNPLGPMQYVSDPLSGMNFNLTPTASLLPSTPTLPLNQQQTSHQQQQQQQQPLPIQQPQDTRSSAIGITSNNLYGLLTQPGTNQFPQLSLSLPAMQPISTSPLMQTTSTIATSITSVAATVVQPLFATNLSSSTTTTTTPTSAVAFNKALNNKPVENVPPANVVITSSDPLPNPNIATVQTQQTTLSVTIPSHHIKLGATGVTGTVPATDATINAFGSSVFSFKPQVAQALQQAANQNESEQQDDDDENANAEADYDAHPDFKPIIPLPDEVEVRTGEEDQETKFCYRAKLFRHVDKEWKERGIGEIKILKHPDGHSRILMRRDQTFKIAANHKINGNIKLTVPTGEKKGFVWVANDFADGHLQLEKFFVRFKLPETALEFKAAFEQAVEEAIELENKQKPIEVEKPVVTSTITPKPIPTTALTFGLAKSAAINSFATSTPAGKNDLLSKLVSTTIVSTATTTTTTNETNKNTVFSNMKFTTEKSETTKTASPFAAFSFNSTIPSVPTTSPFANIFGKLNTTLPAFQTPENVNAIDNTANANKSSVSESDDEYVPTAQFKPLIPLPDLVEVNTGEENENVLFEHRAKLLRFDKSTSEWKERGLGNIKLFRDKNNLNNLRLVMRREQVHKLCCNQRVYKDTKFTLANTSAKNAVTWVGQDYSENELVTETLTLRFKTAETTLQFCNAVQEAQALMSAAGEENNAKEQQKAEDAESKQKNSSVLPEKGFGDQFKPKSGSWDCQVCYVHNKGDTLYCVACETPKDDTVPKKQSIVPQAVNLSTESFFNFGFASKTAIESQPFRSNIAAATTTIASEVAPFTFGKPLQTAAATATTNTTTNNAEKQQGFGDKFKPKVGSWDCEVCYINNKPDTLYCVACATPKDDTVPKQEPLGVLNLSSNATPKFNFGFNVQPNDKSDAGDVSKSFNFAGFTAATITTTAAAATTAATTAPTLGKATFSFSMPMPDSEAAQTSTQPTSTSSPSTTPFSLDKKEFSFILKPKSPGSKANRSAGGGDADALVHDDGEDGEYNEEENNTYFTPVVQLDKIDVKTGEEDEEVLFVHRAKLYRFVENEWKERGLGDVKILRHKTTKKLRVVMRRDQVLKICLNHVLNADVKYKAKDEKSWLFVVNDFSERFVTLEKLSLRFKTKEIAKNFMTAVEEAIAGADKPFEVATKTTASDLTNNNVELSIADKESADKLQYTPPPCAGCRGCNDEEFVFKTPAINEIVKDDEEHKCPLPLELPALEPAKTNVNRSLLKQSTFSPATNKGNSNNNNALTTTSASTFSFTALAKENQISTPSFVFGQAGASSPQKAPPLFSDIWNSKKESTSNKNDTNDNENENETTTEKPVSIFAGTNAGASTVFGSKPTFGKPFFGTLENAALSPNMTKNIFSGTLNKSISGGDGKPLFGSGFGSNNTPVFGGFSNSGSDNKTVSASFINQEKDKKPENLSLGSQLPQLTTSAPTVAATTVPLSATAFHFGSGPDLDFASLAKANNALPSESYASFFSKPPDKNAEQPIKFVGLTNEDAFSSFQKNKANNDNGNDTNKLKNGNDSTQSVGTGDNDENYDPYYEPIIELPKEIVVSTGEENETKLFGDRAILYRYDDDKKEWKERGVGEIKILKHKENETYRLLLRREQVQKLVLNHAIGKDFSFNIMNNNPKSFVWAAMNYAESENGSLEKLAIRFKKVDLAEQFSQKLKECIENAKQKD